MLAAMDTASAADAGGVYKLSPGDIVEIGISSIPERTQRAVIQMDGTIAIPEVGMIAVGGLTPAELQAHMAAILPTKILHQRLPDGREQMIVVKPGDVTAIVAEYRPIYVTGDVLTPGQQAYRPLMTVRQAVAVSGGLAFCDHVQIRPVLIRWIYSAIINRFGVNTPETTSMVLAFAPNCRIRQVSIQNRRKGRHCPPLSARRLQRPRQNR
ncbi:polysaccharide biosynthesis/export family protein [Mesorhizobium sp. ORM8.1]